MKTWFTLVTVLALAFALNAQTRLVTPDTLIQEYFKENMDPSLNMALAPSGFDTVWVNFDQDFVPSVCVDGPPAPDGWYLEGDFSLPTPISNGNSCFTSCSYLTIPDTANENWLIIKRIYIPDTNYVLSWRSLPYNGPAYMDGYLVLISQNSNDPEAAGFTDTLFRAAETTDVLVNDYSTKLNEYAFSPGYIHANGFTDTTYFFKEQISNDPPRFIFRGRLEPHSVKLKAYAGKSVYIAFLHQSTDDFLLQIDDIVVAADQTSSLADPTDLVKTFSISPNPVVQDAYFSWQVNGAPEEVLMRITALDGREVFSRRFAAESVPQYFADLSGLASGAYICALHFPQGVVSKVLIKQ